jgi:hypothetical protein
MEGKIVHSVILLLTGKSMLNWKNELLFGILILMLAVCQSSLAGEPDVKRVAMFNEQEFKKEQTIFSPLDTIYFVIDLKGLEAEEYILTTDWITPMGVITRQTSYTFTLEKFTPDYRIYSWIRLMEKGPLAGSFTGNKFNREVYGEWTVKGYLNGNPIVEQKFEVY